MTKLNSRVVRLEKQAASARRRIHFIMPKAGETDDQTMARLGITPRDGDVTLIMRLGT